jgi:hypothetical protein
VRQEEVVVVAPLELLLLSEGPEEVVRRALQSFYLEGVACLIAV